MLRKKEPEWKWRRRQNLVTAGYNSNRGSRVSLFFLSFFFYDFWIWNFDRYEVGSGCLLSNPHHKNITSGERRRTAHQSQKKNTTTTSSRRKKKKKKNSNSHHPCCERVTALGGGEESTRDHLQPRRQIQFRLSTDQFHSRWHVAFGFIPDATSISPRHGRFHLEKYLLEEIKTRRNQSAAQVFKWFLEREKGMKYVIGMMWGSASRRATQCFLRECLTQVYHDSYRHLIFLQLSK